MLLPSLFVGILLALPVSASPSTAPSTALDAYLQKISPQLLKPSDYNSDALSFADKSHPSVVYGDFDGDNFRDAGVLVWKGNDVVLRIVTCKRACTVLAEFNKGKKVEYESLGEVQPWFFDYFLTKSKKGFTFKDDEGIQRHLANDGLELVLPDKISNIIFWDGKRWVDTSISSD